MGMKFWPGAVSGAGVLMPTGNDDSALVSQFVQDLAASKKVANLGPGDFIIGTPMTWRSRQASSKWGGQGLGLAVTGQGPANTRILVASALGTTTPAFTINAPASAGIANRNYMSRLSGMSILRAPGGTELAAGTTDGIAIYAGPSAAGEVFQGCNFSDLYIDGFNYCITLSDVTSLDIDTIWCPEFLTAIRLGYNCDLIKIRHSLFGSEQFGTTYRNAATAIQSGFNDGFHSPGNGNNIEVDQSWFMKIGCVLDMGAQDIVSFDNSYFENCLQYWKASAAIALNVAMRDCTFSNANVNDDVTKAKMVMGSGATSRVSLTHCDGGGSAPAAAWIENTGFNPTIEWHQNNLVAGPLGHYRWAATGNERSVTLTGKAGSGRVDVVLGSTYGLTRLSGDERVITLGTTGALTVDYWAGDVFEIPALTGNVTVNITGGAVPAVRGMRLKFRVQASASAPSTTTVAFPGVTFSASAPLAQSGASDASKWTTIEVERTASGWTCVSAPNQWVA